jgi:hypothetical protein
MTQTHVECFETSVEYPWYIGPIYVDMSSSVWPWYIFKLNIILVPDSVHGAVFQIREKLLKMDLFSSSSVISGILDNRESRVDSTYGICRGAAIMDDLHASDNLETINLIFNVWLLLSHNSP